MVDAATDPDLRRTRVVAAMFVSLLLSVVGIALTLAGGLDVKGGFENDHRDYGEAVWLLIAAVALEVAGPVLTWRLLGRGPWVGAALVLPAGWVLIAMASYL